jgi:CheY-like chemotaxis protein
VTSLDGRIHALSTAHKLLATARWEGADLQRLVGEELAPYRGRDSARVEISGPSTMLGPAVAQTIALALHELVTNAAKYGALSVDGGRVKVGWEVSPQQVTLRWLEMNGPPTKAPTRSGYGTRVIKGGIEGQLNGTAVFDWQHDGLKCTLVVPRASAKDGDRALSNGIVVPSLASPQPAAQILVVEDEPMISMMLADMLVENGQRVDGPYSKLSDALIAATNNELKAGILDVNVGGASVYPIADILARRNIPFIFMTGYASDTIEPRFQDVPVLQKPIEPQRVWAALSKRQRLEA